MEAKEKEKKNPYSEELWGRIGIKVKDIKMLMTGTYFLISPWRKIAKKQVHSVAQNVLKYWYQVCVVI